MIDGFINIKEGVIQNYSQFQKSVAGLDGRFYYKIERKNKRTNNQNAYYWSCVLPMVLEGLRDMGWNEFEDTEEVHECMKHRFLKKEIPNAEGEAMEKINSTTKLTTVEFGEYLEKIAQWAAEYLGVVIPPPNSQTSMYQ